MSMIEQVGEALEVSFKARIAASAKMPFEETGVTAPSKGIWVAYAKAAMEAMREPTDEMLAAFEDAIGPWLNEVGDHADVYRAMINAALNPKPEA